MKCTQSCVYQTIMRQTSFFICWSLFSIHISPLSVACSGLLLEYINALRLTLLCHVITTGFDGIKLKWRKTRTQATNGRIKRGEKSANTKRAQCLCVLCAYQLMRITQTAYCFAPFLSLIYVCIVLLGGPYKSSASTDFT